MKGSSKNAAVNCRDEIKKLFLCGICAMLAAAEHDVAVFICSSDNRLDVLERVLPSLAKFWPDCPYPIYVGLNSQRMLAPNITTLLAPPSEWRKECLEQLAQIRERQLLVVLDDFLFQQSVD